MKFKSWLLAKPLRSQNGYAALAKEQPGSNKLLMLAYSFVLLGLLAAGLQTRIPVEDLTRDPVAVTGGKFYFGLFSNVGVLIWCATASVSFFSAFVLKKISNQSEFQRFFVASGCLTSLLLLDDLFMLHELFFPNYIGIEATHVFLIYAIAIVLYFISFRKTFRKTRVSAMVTAVAFLVLSIGVDNLVDLQLVDIPSSWKRYEYLVEDGSKLLGILSWFIYFLNASIYRIQLAVETR